MGFTQAELQSFRNASVPDLVGPGLNLLFSVNPGLWAAATRTLLAHPRPVADLPLSRSHPALIEAYDHPLAGYPCKPRSHSRSSIGSSAWPASCAVFAAACGVSRESPRPPGLIIVHERLAEFS